MSSNLFTLDQAEAADPAPAPAIDVSLPLNDLSVLVPSSGGVHLAPAILGTTRITVPVPSQPPVNVNVKPPFKEILKFIADLTAMKGIAYGARYAAGYHRSLNQANPPTEDELMMRDLDARAEFRNLNKYHKHHQGSPNSVALRFLADRAGPGFSFEEDISEGTDRMGNPTSGRKCRGCQNWGPDHKRHNAEKHVKDPALALCCPYRGCDIMFFGGSSRDSEMKLHREEHEKQNNGVQKGRRGIMPLSIYRFAYIQ